MKKLDLVQLKQIQLDILDKISSFCDSNNIRYYLVGGTLLGAVRHKGYIPWDDDIDIAMLRKDYEEFIKQFNVDGYKVFTYKNSDKYCFPFAKIAKTNTLLIEPYETFSDCEIGINIDLFPIDSISKNITLQKFTIESIKIIRFILSLRLSIPSEKRVFYKRLLLLIIKKVVSVKMLLTLINNIAKFKEAERSELLGIFVWGYGYKEIISRKYFSEVIKIEFENRIYNAPIGYDGYLSHVYGDYMKLPPTEKRVTHHDFKAYWKEIEQ